MKLDECMAEGLIKKSDSAPERIQQSVALGDRFLKSAEKNLGMGEFEVCEMVAYMAVFHHARALLFRKGFIERSHACLFSALKVLYPEIEDVIALGDKMRVERHGVQYRGFSSDKDSAEFALQSAKRFADEAKRALKG